MITFRNGCPNCKIGKVTRVTELGKPFWIPIQDGISIKGVIPRVIFKEAEHATIAYWRCGYCGKLWHQKLRRKGIKI